MAKRTVINAKDRIIVPAMSGAFERVASDTKLKQFKEAGHIPVFVSFHDLSMNLDRVTDNAIINIGTCHTKCHQTSTVGARYRQEFDIKPGSKYFDEESDFDKFPAALIRSARAAVRHVVEMIDIKVVDEVEYTVLKELNRRWKDKLIFRVSQWNTVHIGTSQLCIWKKSHTDAGEKITLHTIQGQSVKELLNKFRSKAKTEEYMREIADGLLVDECSMTEVKKDEIMMCGARAERLYQ